jgi:hypothetical protein
MDSGILMIQDSILVCSPDPRIPHTAHGGLALLEWKTTPCFVLCYNMKSMIGHLLLYADLVGQSMDLFVFNPLATTN